jgi:hypothetical protein
VSDASDRIADCLKLGAPAHRALVHAGIVTFADLAGWTREAVADLHGIGPKSFTELDPAMAERGLDYKAP